MLLGVRVHLLLVWVYDPMVVESLLVLRSRQRCLDQEHLVLLEVAQLRELVVERVRQLVV